MGRIDKNNLFWTYYKNLNPAQKKAVDTIEGPVMVVAGPGTGKTSVLTLRIANILRNTDIEPENILALTFTDAAASNMRRRLAEIIGSPAYRVGIQTFHGFCNDLIQSYPEEFPHIAGSKPATEGDQLRLLEYLVKHGAYITLRPFGDLFFYVRDILGAISALKREGVSPEEFAQVIKKEKKEFASIPEPKHIKGPHKGRMKGVYVEEEKRIKKHAELARLYRAYEEELRKKRMYDWNDMIMETLRVVSKNKNFLRILQETHQYVLVDEHQDTNNAQNKVLELLLNFHKNPNVFVVGDERQAIFRFQGASLENFLYFKKCYPGAKLIVLKENYRSEETILKAAGSILPGSPLQAAKKSRAAEKIIIYSSENEETEAALVARLASEDVKKGIQGEEIAILCRENKDAEKYSRALQRKGVPHGIESEKNVLEEDVVRAFILLLRAVERLGNDELLAEALHIPCLEVEPLTIWKMAEEARREKKRLYDVVKERDPKTYSRFSAWKTKSRFKTLPVFLEEALEESGLLWEALKEGSSESVAALRAFFEEIKKFLEARKKATLKDFLSHLETLERHNVAIKRKRKKRPGCVRVMTAHGAKGLEFDSVYIVGAYDGHWGGRKQRNRLPLPKEAEEEDGDERRLFYVALTRARKKASITYSKESASGRTLLPSRFVKEIDEAVREEQEDAEGEKETGAGIFAGKKKTAEKKEKSYLRELFYKEGLSVTALNNYIKCPWRYFYLNLVRVPKLPEPHQTYGIAVHAALRDFFEKLKHEEEGTDFLVRRFTDHLRRAPFLEIFEAWEKRGKEALRGYGEKYKGHWNTNVLTEVGIKGIEIAKNLTIRGKIDKIEFLGSAGRVAVVDYKTGKPKSRKDENLARQLAFYGLLLQEYKNGKYAMEKGVLDFVEPNERGIWKREEFEIEETQKKELVELLKKTADEILHMKFWDTRCEDKTCKYCRLRNFLEQ
ncbi:MAG: ATP-dependent DNA helicase [Patescibacteria group bacterium]